MSRIDDLIAELCPDGVEYKPLAEVIDFKRGKVITEKDTVAGNVPVIAGGRKPAYFHNESNSDGETVVIAGSGAYAGYVTYWEIPIFVSDAFTATPRREDISTRYLYFFLKSKQDQIHRMKSAGGVPHVYSKDVGKLVFPIPPIEIQREIVRILDKMEQLEAELEAELEARRKQYEHYRNALLDFSESPPEWNVRWVQMAEIGSFFGGLTGKSKADFTCGNARFISYVNVFNNLAVDLDRDDFVQVGFGEKQRRLHKGDILFTGSSESTAEVGMSSVMTREPDEPVFLNSFCVGYRLHEPNQLDPEFAKHLFRSNQMRKQIVATASGVTRYNVSKARFAKVKIPLPPLGEQHRISEILDKFDALTESLSSGLPAEIAARRKQYEYYRDKLLTFKEAA